MSENKVNMAEVKAAVRALLASGWTYARIAVALKTRSESTPRSWMTRDMTARPKIAARVIRLAEREAEKGAAR